MNINGYCGDQPEDIAVNRHLLAEELHIEPNRLIMPHQTHKDKIRRIDPDFSNSFPRNARRHSKALTP